jgi:hypothetical protein
MKTVGLRKRGLGQVIFTFRILMHVFIRTGTDITDEKPVIGTGRAGKIQSSGAQAIQTEDRLTKVHGKAAIGGNTDGGHTPAAHHGSHSSAEIDIIVHGKAILVHIIDHSKTGKLDFIGETVCLGASEISVVRSASCRQVNIDSSDFRL